MLNYNINTKGVASEQFQDETIILNLPKGNYYSLRGTGAFIWAQLEKEVTTDQLVQALLNQYDTTADVALPALEAFLNHLVQEELLKETVGSATIATTEIISNSDKLPFIAPVLDTYTDMQDLLMLDPIHEADPDRGWPYKNKS